MTTWAQDIAFGAVMFTAGAIVGCGLTLLILDAEMRRAGRVTPR